MRESEIEKKYRKKVEAEGGLALKFVSPGYSGVPDRLILMPNGNACFVEFKAPGKKPTPRQERVINKLMAMGYKVEVIDAKP